VGTIFKELMGAQPTNILKKREAKGEKMGGVSKGFQFIQSPSGPKCRNI
jgi:hypothetical protein